MATAIKNPKVTGDAYAGGRVRLGGWYYPVVIDLEGLTIPENVPLLANHENRTASRVGQVSAKIEASAVKVAGEITSDSETAKGIVDQAKAGADWQLSVGVEVEVAERVEEGNRVINGQKQEAPFVHIKAGRLREVSVVPVGADINTDLQVKARFDLSGTLPESVKMTTKNTNTPTTTDLEAKATIAERQRVSEIRDICAGGHSDIEAEAIREGWGAEDVYPKVLEAVRAARPQGDFNIHARREGENTRPAQAIEAWFLRRLGREDVAEAMLGGRACEAANRLDANSMLDICQLALRANGIERPANQHEMIRAALSPNYTQAASGGFSTVSVPSILSNVANKSLLHHLKESSPTWQTFCQVRDLNDFKESQSLRLNAPEQLEELGADGEIKHGTLSEENYPLKLDTFAKTLKLTRKMIINDDLGAFREIPLLFAKMAHRKTSDLVYQVLLGAGTHFGSAKGNYLSGGTSPLSCESLGLAVKAMRTQQEDGNDLDIQPSVLVVPPSLEATARAVLESEYVEPEVSGPSGNSMKNIAKLAVEPRLENSTKFGSSASSKAWYLFASPADQPLVVGFLGGKQVPQLDFFDLMADPNTLAVQWRVCLDVAAGLGDPKAAVKSAGE